MTASVCEPRAVQRNPRQAAELSGLSLNPEQQCDAGRETQPLALQWITEELVAYTQDVWAEQLGREVPREEAVEMLVNVRMVAQTFHLANQKGVHE